MLDDLADYVAARVSELTSDAQHRTLQPGLVPVFAVAK